MSRLSLLNSLFILQKRAVRYISLAKPKDSCRPLFISQKILTLYSLFLLKTVCLIHKNRNNFGNENPYNTRQSNKLPLPIPTLTLTKKSIIYESLKLYNHLPDDLKKSNSLRAFKMNVHGLLISKAYYSLDEFYNDTF